MNTTVKLSPLQEAAAELNTAEAEVNACDRDIARLTQKRGVAQERANLARRNYDKLVSKARSADFTR